MAKTSTKKALLASVLSLMLCISMLIGTTFAWFTDSVSSTNNIIKSGRLDVELEYSTDAANWTPVTDTTNIFKDGALWEPGYTEVVYLRVSNKGNLALKYSLGVNIASEIGSTNVNGKEFKLSDFIYFGTKEGAVAYADRDAAIADVAAGAKKISAGYSKSSFLNTQGASEIVTMVVYMPTYVNNDANYAEGEAVPTIKLGLNLFATQKDFEKDGFNTNDYDVYADYDGEVSNAVSLAAAAKNGGTYKIVDDFVLDETIVIEEGVELELDLSDKVITASKTAIENNGTLTIAGSGIIDASSGTENYTRAIYNKGDLTINGGTFKSPEVHGSYAILNAGELELNNGFVDGGFGGIAVNANAKAVINGGTVSNRGDFGAHAVIVWDNAELTINGGNILGHQQTNGNYQYTVIAINSTVLVKGGNFTSMVKASGVKAMFSGNVQVKGGTFDMDPTAMVVNGYEVADNNNGTWTVSAFNALSDADVTAAIANGYDAVDLDRNVAYVLPNNLGSIKEVNANGATITFATSSGHANLASDVVLNDAVIACDIKMGSNSNVTFNDCDFTSENGINYTYGNNIVIENCTFDCGTKAIHLDQLYSSLVVKNSVFKKGRVQIGVQLSNKDNITATFENCVFAQTTETGSIWTEMGIRIYPNTTFKNCEFNNRVILAGEDVDLIFDGCTMNGGQEIVYSSDLKSGIVRGGNVPTVTIK